MVPCEGENFRVVPPARASLHRRAETPCTGCWRVDDDDGLSEREIDEALKQTPKGAFALSGLTVGLLLLAWLAIYVFVFLPRGTVG